MKSIQTNSPNYLEIMHYSFLFLKDNLYPYQPKQQVLLSISDFCLTNLKQFQELNTTSTSFQDKYKKLSKTVSYSFISIILLRELN
jgi:hypothetical protein